jgi:hypothetical protein
MSTLADTTAIHVGEQCRGAVRKGSEQVFRLAWFEPQLRAGAFSPQPGTHRIVRHQPIEFIYCGVVNDAPTLPSQDFLPEFLS